MNTYEVYFPDKYDLYTVQLLGDAYSKTHRHSHVTYSKTHRHSPVTYSKTHRHSPVTFSKTHRHSPVFRGFVLYWFYFVFVKVLYLLFYIRLYSITLQILIFCVFIFALPMVVLMGKVNIQYTTIPKLHDQFSQISTGSGWLNELGSWIT